MYSSLAMKPNIMALLAEMFYKLELEEETLTNDSKARSRSETSMTGFGNPDNNTTTRSSSAPMLASEIIAARSPLVGRKLKDFAKERNQQRLSNSKEETSLDNDKEVNQSNSGRNVEKTKRSYSLQLDFTDENNMADSDGNENPFTGIFRKPVLLNRKHSAPETRTSSTPSPSLNRRAKQKPRTLALDDWEMDEKDVIGKNM